MVTLLDLNNEIDTRHALLRAIYDYTDLLNGHDECQQEINTETSVIQKFYRLFTRTPSKDLEELKKSKLRLNNLLTAQKNKLINLLEEQREPSVLQQNESFIKYGPHDNILIPPIFAGNEGKEKYLALVAKRRLALLGLAKGINDILRENNLTLGSLSAAGANTKLKPKLLERIQSVKNYCLSY